ncbi:kinase-like protein [Karstenula rhodostoma CBS 690.94]|uniref:non-specific serine/threonine protein kinase n=1 Tax=Karstenula rhodostoma CBS 690.94 TaxID=1392251 RepID=A0A9P4PAW9_9PLEO|nr:kinase-like protein [Karstenula rhodostoma CBS 690.94]
MSCGLHLPHLHLHHSKNWYCDFSSAQTHQSGGSVSTPINPADDFPHQHKRGKFIGSGAESNDVPDEVEILKSLPQHDSIISILAYLPKPSTLHGDAVIFEYCPFGDLFELGKDMWQKSRETSSEACLWSIFRQLSAAIAFLHEGIGCRDPKDNANWHPIVHRDIKVENVFVISLGEKQDLSHIIIKLGDFGLAAFYDPSKARMPGWFGTVIAWPPEQTWEGREARPAGDIWATGSVIHELAHGFPPVVNPQLTKALLKDKTGYMYWTWEQSFQTQFWAAKSERKPLPINLDSHEYDPRRRRPTPKYSDKLNGCMMAALDMSMEKRPTAGELTTMIEEEHAAFLCHEMKFESDRLIAESESLLLEEMGVGSIDGEYDEYL